MLIGHPGQQAGLRVVGEAEMGHLQHLTHGMYGMLVGTAIELSVVAHHGVYEDFRAQCGLLSTVVGNDFCLLQRGYEPRCDGIKVETQFVPFLKGLTDIVGALKDGILTIGEGVADEHRGKVEDVMTHIGEDGHLTRCRNLSIAAHIADN